MKRKLDEEELPSPKRRKMEENALSKLFKQRRKMEENKITEWFPFCGFGVYDKKTNKRYSLRSIHHDVELTDHTAKIVSTQLFIHEGSENPIEINYKFPVSEKSIPINVTAEIYERKTKKRKLLKSKIMEKVRAQEKYDDVVCEGNIAFLIERETDNVVCLSLGCIQPETEVKIIFTIIQELEVEVKERDFTIFKDGCENPTIQWKENVMTSKLTLQAMHVSKDHGQNQTTNPLKIVSISVKGVTSGVYDNGQSPSHPKEFPPILFQVIRDGGGNVDKSSGNSTFQHKTTANIANDKDFILLIDTIGVPFVHWTIEKNKEDIFSHAVSVMPNIKEKIPVSTELIIIVDRSGSMSGARMNRAKDAMLLLLKSLDLDSNIRFNVVSFGSSFSFLFGNSFDLNEDSLTTSFEHIVDMTADMRGTDILSPIIAVLKKEIPKGFTRQVFLLTDGEDGNTEAIVKHVRENCSMTRFFTFGIGDQINPLLLDAVAAASNGYSCFISGNGDIQSVVMRQLRRALRPALTDFQIGFPNGFKITHVNGKLPKYVFDKQRQTFYFFSNQPPTPTMIKIRYKIGDGVHEQTLCDVESTTNTIGVIAAKKRIAHLSMKPKEKSKLDDFWGSGNKNEVEALKLGLEFSILSKQTSFIMTCINENPQTGNMEEEKIGTVLYKPKKKKQKERFEEMSLRFMGPSTKSVKKSLSFGRERSRGYNPTSNNFNNDSGERYFSNNSGGGFDFSGGSTFNQSCNNNMSMAPPNRELERASGGGMDQLNISFGSTRYENDDESSDDGNKFLDFGNTEEVVMDIDEPEINLTELLMSSSFDGLFEYSKKIAEMMNIEFSKIEEARKLVLKDNLKNNLWMTAIVIVFLRSRLKENEDQWIFIANRGLKVLQKEQCEWMIEKAKSVLDHIFLEELF